MPVRDMKIVSILKYVTALEHAHIHTKKISALLHSVTFKAVNASCIAT